MELLLSSLSLAAVAEVALIRFVAFAAQITKKIVIATEKVKARYHSKVHQQIFLSPMRLMPKHPHVI